MSKVAFLDPKEAKNSKNKSGYSIVGHPVILSPFLPLARLIRTKEIS